MRRDLPRQLATIVSDMAKGMEVIRRDIVAVTEGIMSHEPDEASRTWVQSNVEAAELLKARLEASLEALGQAAVYLAEGNPLPGYADDGVSTNEQFAAQTTQ